MDSPLCYEDISVGQSWTSPRRTVTEADVINFATMTGDFNPLHVDYDYAANSHYRQPVAHGLLGLAWVAGLGSFFPQVKTMAFTGIKNWEFVRPLFFGDTVYVKTEVVEKTLSGRRNGRVIWHRQLFNQRDEVVQQGQFETLVEVRDPSGRPHMPKSNQPQSGFEARLPLDNS